MITTVTPTTPGTYIFVGLTSRTGGWQDIDATVRPHAVRVIDAEGIPVYALNGEHIDPRRLVGAWQRVELDEELMTKAADAVRVRTARSVFRRALRGLGAMRRNAALERAQVTGMVTLGQRKLVAELLDLAVAHGFVLACEVDGAMLYAWGKP